MRCPRLFAPADRKRPVRIPPPAYATTAILPRRPCNSLKAFLCLKPEVTTTANPIGIPKDAIPLAAASVSFPACQGQAP